MKHRLQMTDLCIHASYLLGGKDAGWNFDLLFDPVVGMAYDLV